MPASYLPYEPDQDFLLPPSMREWLPDGHLAFFINDTVEALDLSAFHARYDKGGPRNQPYRKRKWIAEPPNGWIKNVLGFRQFSLRGLHRVQAEWKLLNAALNLRRMCSLRTT